MPKVNWVEIPVTYLERASTFYKSALGVNISIVKAENVNYGVMKLNGEVGGILFETEKINHGIVIYLHVERMGEILSKIERCGGTILQGKTLLKSYNDDNLDIISGTLFDGKIGYFAKIKDTEGNIIGLHSNA